MGALRARVRVLAFEQRHFSNRFVIRTSALPPLREEQWPIESSLGSTCTCTSYRRAAVLG